MRLDFWRKRPTKVPPATPETHTMSSTINVKLVCQDQPVPYGASRPRIRLSFGTQSVEEAAFQHYCDDQGTVSIELIPAGPYRLYPLAEGYEGDALDVVMPHDDQLVIEMRKVGTQPIPLPSSLSRLTATREGFRNEQGQRVFIAGASAFMHYERFLNGTDIRDMLQQVKDLGANTIRVFGMAHYIPVNAGRRPFKPSDYGDRYFDAQPEFFDLAASYGLYVYWSVFPDAELIDPGDKRAFFDREVSVLKSRPNTFGELTNEQDAHSFNAVDPSQMNRPSGIAFCSGSYGDIGGLQPYPWDFCDYHQPRRYDPPTHIKDACVVDHPNYLAGKGILLGEPDRYGWDGNGNTEQARLSAGACRESSLGQVFHSTKGRESLPYDDQTLQIAQVFFKALVGPA